MQHELATLSFSAFRWNDVRATLASDKRVANTITHQCFTRKHSLRAVMNFTPRIKSFRI